MFEVAADERAVATWFVDSSPELLIEDQGLEPLFEIRAGRQFADGGFVVANQGSHELRFYSRTGILERSVGRDGSGPDEFRLFDFLEVIADSVWVCDRQNQRISVVDRAGELVRLISLADASTMGLVRCGGVFGDGSVLLLRAEPGTAEPGLRRSFRRHLVLHPGGSISGLGRFFRGESYWVSLGSDIADIGRPFAREGLTAVRGSEWFYSEGGAYRIEQHDIGGPLRAVYSYAAKPRSVTQRDLEDYLKDIRAEIGGSGPREQLLRRAPLPERMPAYAGLLIDREGNVWAAPHAGAQLRNCWHVYQPRPPRFAKACLPDRFMVLDVARGSVLGVLRDENDVERIARYRLMK